MCGLGGVMGVSVCGLFERKTHVCYWIWFLEKLVKVCDQEIRIKILFRGKR